MIAFTDGAYYLTYDPFIFVKHGIFGFYPWTGLEISTRTQTASISSFAMGMSNL
jgi:hypothetical protein